MSWVLVADVLREVRRIVVGGGGKRTMGDEVNVTVVGLRVLNYWESGERGVGVELASFGVDDWSGVQLFSK